MLVVKFSLWCLKLLEVSLRLFWPQKRNKPFLQKQSNVSYILGAAKEADFDPSIPYLHLCTAWRAGKGLELPLENPLEQPLPAPERCCSGTLAMYP